MVYKATGPMRFALRSALSRPQAETSTLMWAESRDTETSVTSSGMPPDL